MITITAATATILAAIITVIGGVVATKLRNWGNNINETLDDHNERISNMEQWLTGDNGDSKGAVGRASEERQAIMEQLEAIRDDLEHSKVKQQQIAYNLSQVQQELCEDDSTDVSVEPIDMEDDFLDWDH